MTHWDSSQQSGINLNRNNTSQICFQKKTRWTVVFLTCIQQWNEFMFENLCFSQMNTLIHVDKPKDYLIKRCTSHNTGWDIGRIIYHTKSHGCQCKISGENWLNNLCLMEDECRVILPAHAAHLNDFGSGLSHYIDVLNRLIDVWCNKTWSKRLILPVK